MPQFLFNTVSVPDTINHKTTGILDVFHDQSGKEHQRRPVVSKGQAMSKDRAAAMLHLMLALSCALVGLAAQGVFIVWVLALGLGHVLTPALGPSPVPVICDVALLCLFALQHSGMARTRFKTWSARFIPTSLERACYVLFSGLVLFALILGWQTVPGPVLWEVPWWSSGAAILGLLGTGVVTLWFDAGFFLGLKQARAVESNQAVDRLQVSGPYRFVRHPQMSLFLLFLWGHAVMTPTLALLSGGLTAYILMAIRWEEAELERKFGARYAEYRRRVPALLPWRWPRS
jgi:protein-S-isoprenylcysteine O-methyltransferase Ste14